ncbi:MAG: PEGA domain-containing protein [Deltaproteobacteria bacterium]|nr:PEGA domain-containing protein [Deltaproteobacteria bacterium]
MSDPYRDEHEAALQALETLRRENESLRAALRAKTAEDSSAGYAAAPSTRIPTLTAIALLVAVAGLTWMRLRPAPISAHAVCPHAHGQVISQALAHNRTGTLRVEVTPAVDVDVTVDHTPLGMSGTLALSGPLEAGRAHHLAVQAPGYVTHESDVFVQANRNTSISIRLQPSATGSSPSLSADPD